VASSNALPITLTDLPVLSITGIIDVCVLLNCYDIFCVFYKTLLYYSVCLFCYAKSNFALPTTKSTFFSRGIPSMSRWNCCICLIAFYFVNPKSTSLLAWPILLIYWFTCLMASAVPYRAPLFFWIISSNCINPPLSIGIFICLPIELYTNCFSAVSLVVNSWDLRSIVIVFLPLAIRFSCCSSYFALFLAVYITLEALSTASNVSLYWSVTIAIFYITFYILLVEFHLVYLPL
jgi:hypothetical protein